ncbi:DUF1116 domain-containing protein [Trichococcus collinsii]|uniref:DUF1116 domain-containing protein n=1 Tax=Trichococcus collinsii TaxID=157076 RepID=A0AB38A3C3_9LACT|nr:DUF1116 domain-containing protein [Trichococcus collinsii]CZQ99956.1 Hypothetical protein Tcol_1779 [Trichococcus collinsii]SEA88920.1 Protein of unknown function [Trichococcus collinsii]
MTKRNELFQSKVNTVNVGIEFINEDLKKQGIKSHQVNWAPPAGGDAELLKLLDRLNEPETLEKIQKANEEAVSRIIQSKPILVGYDKALNVMPNMTKNTILHAGPPIAYADMCGPMQGAIQGAIIFEGLASDLEEADQVARSGEIIFSPCHEHDAVGSMAGVTSASMYVHIIKNETYGNVAYTNLSEQLAKVLRFGANDQTVIDRLVWMRDVMGPMLHDAMKLCPKGIDLRLMLSQALHMGDECHNRNVAGTTLLVQALTPYIVQTDFTKEQMKEVFEFIASSDYFSGPTWMGAAKCALDAGHNVENSTIVTTMCRNGVEFGIRVSGIGGNNWFTGPAQRVIGPMFAGYTQADAGLDMGDSAITETYGIGGFAMAAAPAIVPLVGGTVAEALNYSREMKEITTAENPNITIPVLNFMGIPSGIDVLKVMETGMLPIINTAIAHKDPGVGMIGAGLTNPPMNVFKEALVALAAKIH